jgi:hypothetical protein
VRCSFFDQSCNLLRPETVVAFHPDLWLFVPAEEFGKIPLMHGSASGLGRNISEVALASKSQTRKHGAENGVNRGSRVTRVRRLTPRRDGTAEPTNASALTFASVAVPRTTGTLTITESIRCRATSWRMVPEIWLDSGSRGIPGRLVMAKSDLFLANQNPSNGWQLHCMMSPWAAFEQLS